MMNMKPAMMTDTKPPAKPTPRPTAAQIAARCALRHMIPSAAPRNIPIEAGDRREQQETRPTESRVARRRALSSKNGSRMSQARNAPSPLARLR